MLERRHGNRPPCDLPFEKRDIDTTRGQKGGHRQAADAAADDNYFAFHQSSL
jgi:hypothetical protein